MIAQELIDYFEQWAPKSIAEDGDPVGLQLGNPQQEIHKVMTTLDVRPEVVAEAIAQHADFIFAHHPMIFRAPHNLDLSVPQNEMYAQLMKHDIVVYGAHTNLDNVNGGMNDWLAAQLELSGLEPLLAGGTHPITNEHYGMGRVGQLAQAMSVEQFGHYVAEKFDVPALRIVAGTEKQIQRVAVLGGSGGQFYLDAVNHQADAYVTGDISYHTGHDIIANGLVAVDPGHHFESICKAKLHLLFEQWKAAQGWQVEIIESKLSTEPFKFMMR
ncbi:Nif3-like dinuclear metal center hexameric protein [Paucilactobacillus nenjiangensis]|uniref:GTP cyclohydrolase 1 type 2 homolog n=1 Tax=Paucilactobacillus nenjiangensis TaxID=1296540 RepID=A0A5P1X0X6_9LACO|nr:Nif3-like dinuclear metal center hexameric protein [Paucilactobacillus nenjiangensis]QER67466.1 Nif3-like dinuclear metal center hexameric protein [Paucilactobacillus nenjiangensis]